MINIEQIISEFKEKLAIAINKTQLFEIKNNFLSTTLKPIYEKIKEFNGEEKTKYGIEMNRLKTEINNTFDIVLHDLISKEDSISNVVKYDTTITTAKFSNGALNPVTIVINDIVEYFVALGFEIHNYNEVCEIKYNFDNLNVPENHPTRNTSDTFYVNEKFLLRTQTTAGTAEAILNNKSSDLRVINFGNVYRNDDDDMTHSHQFRQIDFVWIKKDLSIGNLKWLLNGLVKKLFGDKCVCRFRLSNFPFTEPSFEVDSTCPFCNGKGCNICKQTGWIELLGCGMLHPNVLTKSNIENQSGFAAGIGLERIAMIKFGISDVREIYNNNFKTIEYYAKRSVK